MCDAEKYHLQVASLAPSHHALSSAGPDTCAYCGQYLFLCGNEHGDCLALAAQAAAAAVAAVATTATSATTTTTVVTTEPAKPRVIRTPIPLRDGSCCISASTCGGTSNGTGSSAYSSPKLDAIDVQPHPQQVQQEVAVEEESRTVTTAAPHYDLYDAMQPAKPSPSTSMHRLHPSHHHNSKNNNSEGGSEEDGGEEEEDDDGGGPHMQQPHQQQDASSHAALGAMKRWNAQDNGGRGYDPAAGHTERHVDCAHVDPTGHGLQGNNRNSSDDVAVDDGDTRPQAMERGGAAVNRHAMHRRGGSGQLRRSQVAASATAHIRYTALHAHAHHDRTNSSSNSDGDDVLREDMDEQQHEEEGQQQQQQRYDSYAAVANDPMAEASTTTITTTTMVAVTLPTQQSVDAHGKYDENEEEDDDEEEEEEKGDATKEGSRNDSAREPPHLVPPHPRASPQTFACSPRREQQQQDAEEEEEQQQPSCEANKASGNTAAAAAAAVQENASNASGQLAGEGEHVITEGSIPLSDARFACHAITRFVNTLCALNASEPVPSSDFHSYCVPPMTVELYVDRILRYCECSAEALLCGFLLLLKYSFYSGHPVNIYNAHRLLITSTVLGIKMRDDKYYSNMYYARIGGIVGKEMNKLEVLFLSKLNWQLEVTPYEYAEMLTLMHAMMQKPSVDALRAFAAQHAKSNNNSNNNNSNSSGKAAEQGIHDASQQPQHASSSPTTNNAELATSGTAASPEAALSEEQQLRADYGEAYEKDFWQRRIAPWLTRLQQASFARDAEHARLKQEDWQREAARWRRYLAEEYAEAMQKSLSPSQTSRWTSPQSIHSASTYASNNNNNTNNTNGGGSTAAHSHTNFLYQTESSAGAQAALGMAAGHVRYTNFDYQYPAVYQGVPIAGAGSPSSNTNTGRMSYAAGGGGGGRATPQSQVMASACHTNNRFGFANFFGQYSSATYQASPTKANNNNNNTTAAAAAASSTSQQQVQQPLSSSSSASAAHQGFGILHRTSEPTAWSPTAAAAKSAKAAANVSSKPGETASRTSSVTVPGSGINIHAQPYYYTKHRAGHRSSTATTPATTTTTAATAVGQHENKTLANTTTTTTSTTSNSNCPARDEASKAAVHTTEEPARMVVITGGGGGGQASPPTVSASNPAMRCSNWSSPTARQPPSLGGNGFAGQTQAPPQQQLQQQQAALYETARAPTTATLATTISTGGSLSSPSSTSRTGTELTQWQPSHTREGSAATAAAVTTGNVRTSFPSVPPTYSSAEGKATMVVASVAPEKPTRMAGPGASAKPLARTSNAGKKRPKPASYNDYYQ